MKRILITFWLLTFACLSLVRAQQLDEMIADAISNNLQIRALENEYLAAYERAPQVGQIPDPEIGVGGFLLPVETRLGTQGVRLSGTQLIPWPGLLENKRQLENAKARALQERVRARELEIAFDVKRNYFKLYLIQEREDILIRNIEILMALEKMALAKVESGKALASDAITVQIRIAELEKELLVLEKAEVTPRVNLNQLLNRDLNTPCVISDTLVFAVLPYVKDSILSQVSQFHPQMRMFELQQEVSRQAMEVNALSGRPDLGVGVDYITVSRRSDADPVNNGRDILQLRASVSIPIFREKYAAKNREEHFRIEALENQRRDAISRFTAAIETAYADHETARLDFELLLDQIELTNAALRILKEDFSVNGQNFDELLRLETALVNYQFKMYEAVVRSHIALSAIERFIPNSNKINYEDQ